MPFASSEGGSVVLSVCWGLTWDGRKGDRGDKKEGCQVRMAQREH